MKTGSQLVNGVEEDGEHLATSGKNESSHWKLRVYIGVATCRKARAPCMAPPSAALEPGVHGCDKTSQFDLVVDPFLAFSVRAPKT